VGVLPLYPRGLEVFRPLETLDAGWKVLAFSFCAILLTGVLFNMNTLVFRLFEGYPWRDSIIGRWFTKRESARYCKAKSSKANLETLLNTLPAGSEQFKEVSKHLRAVAGILEKSFPDQDNLVLPTRFGNAIRAFEVYPRRQYRMAAIELWPRLLAVINSTYFPIISDAKTMVDFLVNSSLLAAVLAFSALLFGLRNVAFGPNLQTVTWLLRTAGFAAISYWFYSSAVRPAQEWGQHVRGAFDLFRSDLLAKLGIIALPATLDEERRIWSAVSNQLVFPDAAVFRLPLRVPPPAAVSQNRVAVSVIRSLGAKPAGGGPTPVQLTVVNSTAKDAHSVLLTEQPPTGMEYFSNSLRPRTHVNIRRSSPLEFEVTWVPANGHVTLQYQAIGL